jgi:hypothetical protein
MIHDIQFEVNWDSIKNNKEKTIATSNKRENLNRIKHKYNDGDRILLQKPDLINYSHSRNPPCAPARTHGRIQAPREPPN